MNHLYINMFVYFLLFQIITFIIFNLICLKWSRAQPKLNKDDKYKPSVTIVVPCYNEENTIINKLKNIYDTHYSKKLLKVYVIDDGSDDKTYQTAKIFKKDQELTNLFILKNPNKKGKASALNWLFPRLSDEIVISTDADVLWKRNTLGELVANFNDPSVGAVTGKILINENTDTVTKIERMYRNVFDLWRKAESNIDSCSVFNGPIMGFRSKIVEKIKINENTYADDIDLLYKVRKLGYKGIYEPKAIVFEYPPNSYKELFKQKIRRSNGLTQILLNNLSILGRYGRFGKIIYPFSLYNHVISPVFTFITLLLIPAILFSYPYLFIGTLFLAIPKIRIMVTGYIIAHFSLLLGILIPRKGRWDTYREQKISFP